MSVYHCPGCGRCYSGPDGTRLVGARYLNALFAFQSAELGCPRCGGALQTGETYALGIGWAGPANAVASPVPCDPPSVATSIDPLHSAS